MSAPPVRVKREEPDGGATEAAAVADERISRDEQEEALVALIEHRTKEVEHLRQRMTYYKSQLDQAERRLDDSQSKLARLRGRSSVISSKVSQGDHSKGVQAQQKSAIPPQMCESPSHNQPLSRPQLIIPAANPKVSQPVKMVEAGTHASTSSQARMSVPSHTNSTGKLKGDRTTGTSNDKEATETPNRGIKRKFEQKEHKELIPLIRSSSSPNMVRCQTGSLISSQHKRKLRSLELCPINDRLFVTSALDGVINLWETRGSSANLLTSTDSLSPKQRRWAEDIAWHPEGNSLFAVYTADKGDSQIAILDLNQKKSASRVKFLEEKPHVKGIINNIAFMPWDDVCFVTGGSDHAVVLWSEKDGENVWKPKALHRNLHSSAVMGVAGMQQKQIILSAGADKRIIGYNLEVGRADYKHQIESKCMSILPNPSDFNLFMVQTGTPERQLRLFDIRLRQTEIHSFGFKQESSESQSALINQAWSPDGMYITSGSVDPIIHIFDIRYNAHKPSQSIKAHQKRVFKAVWHYSLPLMISISSDLNIGLHRIN